MKHQIELGACPAYFSAAWLADGRRIRPVAGVTLGRERNVATKGNCLRGWYWGGEETFRTRLSSIR